MDNYSKKPQQDQCKNQKNLIVWLKGAHVHTFLKGCMNIMLATYKTIFKVILFLPLFGIFLSFSGFIAVPHKIVEITDEKGIIILTAAIVIWDIVTKTFDLIFKLYVFSDKDN